MVRYSGRTPIDQKEVNTHQLIEVIGPIVVSDCVIRFGSVVIIADIINRNLFTIDFRPGQYCQVWLPVPDITRRDENPPGD